MAPVGQFHVRVVFLLGAVGVLFFLRKPLQHPDRSGSKGFALTVLALSLWLGCAGLSYFVPARGPTLALYNGILFGILVSAIGWVLIATEFVTRRLPARRHLLVLAALAVVHFVVLWTNFAGLHELLYRSSSTVENAVLQPVRGPLFWVHAAIAYGLIVLATVLLVAEWANESGLRQRQAGILAVTPALGLGVNLAWLAGVVELSFDPTPVGTTAGVVILSYALYRGEFLEIAPIGRQTVVEEMTDAVVILDDQNRVVDWNRAATTLFDVTDASVGMSARAFFEPVPDDTLARLAETDRTETQLSVELDGRQRHLSVLISPVSVGDAEALGRVVVVRDITALKRREQQLVRQNEYLDEFAGIVSHDLQGPLMEIRGSADMAVKTGDVEHVEHVLDAADRMDALVDDLLELARTGQQRAESEPVALAAVAERAWRRVWAPDAALAVETDATIRADPGRLQQLLENLFRNAVEHGRPETTGGTTGESSPRDSDLTVTIGALSEGFYVEDDGPGIPPSEREQVFERGYTTADEGTGLGLGIVEQIAGAHGWSVRVTEGASGGARFELTGVAFTPAEESP